MIEECYRVVIATKLLGPDARRWWQNLKETSVTITWAIFVERFKDRYFSQYIKDQKRKEFFNLFQGIMSVVEYESKFLELREFVPESYTTRDLYKRFEDGLNLNIRDRIKSGDKYESLDDLVEEALRVEGLVQARHKLA